MQQENPARNVYFVSQCVDTSLNVKRSKRFAAKPVESLAHLMVLISDHKIWSPITWRSGRNLRADFKAAYYMVLDLDNSPMTLEAGRQFLRAKNLAGLIHTTKSHQLEKSGNPPCDRFRIICPFEKPVMDLKTYEYNMSLWIKPYFADEACKTGNAHFLPALSGVEFIDGENMIPVRRYIAPPPRPKSPLIGARKIPAWLESKIQYGIPGQSRHHSLFHIAATLSAFGFSEAEVINIVMQSPVWEQGPDEDSRRTARDGWRQGQQG